MTGLLAKTIIRAEHIINIVRKLNLAFHSKRIQTIIQYCLCSRNSLKGNGFQSNNQVFNENNLLFIFYVC